MDLHDHWHRVWTTRDAESVSWHQDDPAPSLRMIAAADLEPDTAVVDVGGGASRLVDRLLAEGYGDLTVLDIAAPALEQAQRRLEAAAERVAWVAGDVLAWQPQRRYGLWHDRAVLHFLTTPERQQAYRAAIERALSPGGTAIIAAFALDGPEKCSGLTVCRHDGESLSALLGPSFRLMAETNEHHRTPGGAAQSFCWCRFVRKG